MAFNVAAIINYKCKYSFEKTSSWHFLAKFRSRSRTSCFDHQQGVHRAQATKKPCMGKGKDKPTVAQNCLPGALRCLITGCQLEKGRGVRQKKHTGANQQRRTKGLVSCTYLGCMREIGSIFKKREQYTYHSALQRRNQNGGKENRGKTNEKPRQNQVLLHSCQRQLRCHFPSQGRSREDRTQEDQEQQSEHTNSSGEERASKGWQARGQSRSGGRAARWTRGWPLSSAAVARSGGRSQTPSGAASEKPLRTSALPRGRPRPMTPARGCAGRSRRRERPLPPQAFVHEAQIPAVAVAVLILDFRLPRCLHGTGDGERDRNRRPAQGLKAQNTPPGSAEARPDGAGRKPPPPTAGGPFPARTASRSRKPEILHRGRPSLLRHLWRTLGTYRKARHLAGRWVFGE